MSGEFQAIWDGHDRAEWDAACARARAALHQDWAYGEAMQALGATLHRAAVLRDGETVALAQFTSRRMASLLNFALCSRGPVWLADLTAPEKIAVHRLLKSRFPEGRPRAVIFTPDEESAAAVKPFTRVMTGHSTVLIDLDRPLEEIRAGFHGKWRNRLVAAEKSDLKIVQNGVKPGQYAWLLRTEEGQRKARGYAATPAALAPAWLEAKGDKEAMLILRADQGKTHVAAMMFLIHGEAATYQIGFSDEAGRKLGAHNRLLWEAIGRLKARGVKQLDLGGVNTQSGAGIARFKIGTGGEVVTLAGSFV